MGGKFSTAKKAAEQGAALSEGEMLAKMAQLSDTGPSEEKPVQMPSTNEKPVKEKLKRRFMQDLVDSDYEQFEQAIAKLNETLPAPMSKALLGRIAINYVSAYVLKHGKLPEV